MLLTWQHDALMKSAPATKQAGVPASASVTDDSAGPPLTEHKEEYEGAAELPEGPVAGSN